MAYTSSQQRIIDAIVRYAKKRYGKIGKAEKVKIKSAFLTGRVESNFTNSSRMTDHDSQGWRQERKSLYPNPTNIRASVRRYFDEADQHFKPGMKSGDLAANVQRPAAQYRGRYAQHSREGQKLLNKYFKNGGGGTAPVEEKAPDGQKQNVTGRRAALLNYLDTRDVPGATLELAKNLRDAQSAEPEAPADTPKPAKKAGGGGRSNPWEAAMAAGATVSSAKRPGAITSSGNISDHSHSEPGMMARDFVGKDMDKIARAIARSLGIKNYKPGSIVNVNKGGYRYQLIWGTSDHKDHVHLGRRKIR